MYLFDNDKKHVWIEKDKGDHRKMVQKNNKKNIELHSIDYII